MLQLGLIYRSFSPPEFRGLDVRGLVWLGFLLPRLRGGFVILRDLYSGHRVGKYIHAGGVPCDMHIAYVRTFGIYARSRIAYEITMVNLTTVVVVRKSFVNYRFLTWRMISVWIVRHRVEYSKYLNINFRKGTLSALDCV